MKIAAISGAISLCIGLLWIALWAHFVQGGQAQPPLPALLLGDGGFFILVSVGLIALLRKLPSWLVTLDRRLRLWTSLFLAVALGPLFMLAGNAIPGMVFATAGWFYSLVCFLVLPTLMVASGRLEFLVWQVGVLSLAVSILVDNLRANSIHHNEAVGLVFTFWVIGTLVSSPFPIYLLLRPLTLRQRFICGAITIVVGAMLWFVATKVS